MKAKLPTIVATAILLEACLYFYFAYCFANMFRVAHATLAQVFTAISGSLLIGLLFLAAAATYWTVPQVRPWLRILAIAGAIYGTYDFLAIHSAVRNFSTFFQRDIVAISAIYSIWLLVIGFLAAIDHFASKSERPAWR
ncbi:hypothetical protein [Granulicella arctica]|uniref:hypothetical protein n=1 Tax=Granulicella arctica TaxID=940613 RepID=UPI0021DF65DD|nr:hypothetical protein [Granulicella arctica]